ncbi:MAG: hypothetical protein CBB78_004180 [Roseibacillus sp. TMED18]|nr:MAG: hypothetical protein CBB78_004180 [Roseibacillus sp. TMED18]
MKSEPPDQYEELKALLSKSFSAEEGEDIPPIPDQIRDRIQDQYGKKSAAPGTSSTSHEESFIARISRLFAQPQFSGAMAAVALIAVAAFFLIPERDDAAGGSMRGKQIAAPEYPITSVVLYGLAPDKAEAIKGVLDPNVAIISETISGEPAAEGITIIINGEEGTIEGYSGPSSEAITAELSSDEFEVGKVISEMVRKLRDRPAP